MIKNLLAKDPKSGQSNLSRLCWMVFDIDWWSI